MMQQKVSGYYKKSIAGTLHEAQCITLSVYYLSHRNANFLYDIGLHCFQLIAQHLKKGSELI